MLQLLPQKRLALIGGLLLCALILLLMLAVSGCATQSQVPIAVPQAKNPPPPAVSAPKPTGFYLERTQKRLQRMEESLRN